MTERTLTFNAADCYQLFLAVDDRMRQLRPSRRPPALGALRERLLPFYKMENASNLERCPTCLSFYRKRVSKELLAPDEPPCPDLWHDRSTDT